MRFLVDTNILVYAASSSFVQHAAARPFLDLHLRNRTPFCLTWPIVYEFLRVMTHHRVLPNPLTASQSLAFIATLLQSGAVTMLAATDQHADVLRQTLTELGHPSGNLFHDIHTAVVMREHGVPEIATADTDFFQFKFLRVTNPVAP